MACKRKQWTTESMENAVNFVKKEGKGLREAARAFNVPVETLRRRVNGTVSLDCRPGPSTVLTKEEEAMICDYLIRMADMGYGLSQETVMTIAYKIAEKFNKTHPFTGESAGRSWFDGFRHRHPQLTIRTPLPLSSQKIPFSDEHTTTGSSVSDLVKPEEILVLPEPKVPKKRREGINSKAVCITDMLEEMKETEKKKAEEKREKEEKKQEREEKRKNKLKEEESKKKEKEEKKRLKEIEKEQQKIEREAKKKQKGNKDKTRSNKETVCIGLAALSLLDDGEEDLTRCPICDLLYQEDNSDDPWVCCDSCDTWFDFKCTGIRNAKRIPKVYYCNNCQY